ncbi:uncharacterized protein LOC141666390 [Apium graveolens]|uniref:uncharacterized protein LOC141666390 n=1 Tax=Apium graveolens TaxID=4045 RepID=UPI003D792D7E
MAMPSSNTIKMALPSSNTINGSTVKMTNLAKLEFVALDVSGDNYLSWVVNAELHLSANGLKDTIESGKTPSVEQNGNAIIFLRHHIHENLKSEYLTVKNPLTLWNNLKDRFDHQKLVHLPHARRMDVEKGIEEDEITDGIMDAEIFVCDGHNNNSGHQKWQNEMPNKRKAPPEGDTRDIYFRCGAHGHWTRTCRTPKHLVELYESSKKQNGQRMETNLARYNDEPMIKNTNELENGVNIYYGLDD